jgi:hypothetical protein
MRSASGTDKIALVVQAFSSVAMDSEISMRIAEKTVWNKKIRLEPGRPVHLQLTSNQIAQTLVLTLKDDALAADNTVVLPPVAIKTVRAAITGLPDTKDALLKALASIPDTETVGDSAQANLVFTDAPNSKPSGRTVRTVRLPQLKKGEKPLLCFGRDIVGDSNEDLVNGLTLDGVLWSYAPKKNTSDNRPLLSYNSVPLLSVGEKFGTRWVYDLNLLPDRSNIARQTAWPILVQGFVEDCREAMPGLSRTTFRLGEDAVLSFDTDAALPSRFAIKRDGTLLETAESPPQSVESLPIGLYEVQQEGSKQTDRFAVNLFSTTESDLRALNSQDIDFRSVNSESREQSEPDRRIVYAMLILAIAGVALSWICQDTSR